MAKKILKNILVENNQEVTIEKIQKRVAEHFQIKINELSIVLHECVHSAMSLLK